MKKETAQIQRDLRCALFDANRIDAALNESFDIVALAAALLQAHGKREQQ